MKRIAALLVAMCMLFASTAWAETVRGDLGDRFADAPTVEYNGKTYRQKKNITTILVMGTDVRDNERNLVGFRNGGQADFQELIIVDDDSQTISQIAIDRDTMAELTVLGTFGNNVGTYTGQITLAHSFGDGGAQSCELTVEAVSRLYEGINIDFYIALNMTGLVTLNDLLGGVTVPIEDDFSSADPTMVIGTDMQLSGMQVDYYVRRRMDIGDGSNTGRMRRQRIFMKSAAQLIRDKLSDDINYIGTLFDGMQEYMTTDMARGRMINIAAAARNYTDNDTLSATGEHIIAADRHMEFYADAESIHDIVMQVFYEEVTE